VGVGVGLAVGDAVAVGDATALAAETGVAAGVGLGDAVRRTTFSTAFSTDWIGAGTFSPHATSATARSATATRLLTEQEC
jgi:hypothetical protein